MKVIKKYFIIALLLSLIFSIGMVAAQEHQENITFEQSNIDDVSDETFTVPSEDQEVNQVEQDSSLSQGEDSDDNLGAGQTFKFSDAQTQINSASRTLYLGNNTYISDSDNAITVSKVLTIHGGNGAGSKLFSTFNAQGRPQIFSITSAVDVVFENIIFMNAYNFGDGGAVSRTVQNDKTITFKNCIFINNHAKNGGAVYNLEYRNNYRSYLEFHGCQFINNHASQSGGAIYSNRRVIVENCNFVNNSAQVSGGSICIENVYSPSSSSYANILKITSSNFTNSKVLDAGSKGGAVFVQSKLWDDNSNIIEKSNFINCQAKLGGALYLTSVDYNNNLKNLNFINNSAEDYGGAIYSTSDRGSWWDCYFMNNSAKNGGAIYILDPKAKLQIINGIFNNNSANLGGAIYYYQYFKNSNYFLEIATSSFYSNIAQKGGAIYDSGLKTSITQSHFSNNVAGDDSRTVYMTVPYDNNQVTGVSSSWIEKKFENNQIDGNRGEILFDRSTFGLVELNILNIKYSNSDKEVEVTEGKRKLYATLTTKRGGHPVSVNNAFNFTVGDYTEEVYFKDGYAEIEYEAHADNSPVLISVKPADPNNYQYMTFWSYNVDNEIVYSYPSLSYMNDYNWEVNLKINPEEYRIVFDDIEGKPGDVKFFNVAVTDNLGNPVKGSIFVIFGTNDAEEWDLDNEGRAEPMITLPLDEDTYDLTVRYKSAVETKKVKVEDYTQQIPERIDWKILPANLTFGVYDGRTIEVQVKDQNNRPLPGIINYTFCGISSGVYANNEGIAHIDLNMPENEGTYVLRLSMFNKNKVVQIKVVDNGAPIVDEDVVVIGVPYKMVGHVGKQIDIPINVHDGNHNPLNCTVIVSGAGQEHPVTIVNGKGNCILILPDRPVEFAVVTRFNENHSAVTMVKVIESNSQEPTNDTQVIIQLDDIVAFKNTNIPVSVLIHDSNGFELNGDIFVSYLNVINHKQELKDGRATVWVGLPSYPTTFVLTVNYEGTVKQIFVNVVDAKNPLGNITTLESSENKINVILPNDATGTVILTINGKEYIADVINGTATVEVDDLPNGQYDADLHYSGDTKYSESEKPVVVVIKDSDVVDPKNPMGNLKELKSDKNGQVIVNLPVDANGEVILSINGKIFSENVYNGKAIFDLSEFPDGTFQARVTYTGDSEHGYSSSTKNVNVTIATKDPVDPKNPLGGIDEITSTGDGKVEIPFPADATGMVKVIIEGKPYYAEVKDGKAEVDTKDLTDGKYTANVEYYGDSKYSSSKKDINMTIKHQSEGDHSNPMGDITEVTSSDDGKITIPFPSDATGAVKVTIDGKIYFGDVVDGKAVVDVNDLSAGEHDAKVEYYGDGKYSPSAKNITVKVKDSQDVDPTNPIGNITEVTSSDDGKVTIPFPSDATGVVKVTINGKDYYGQVKDGKVVLDTSDLPSGNYPAIVNYYGDNKYPPSQNGINITIKNDGGQNTNPTNPLSNVTEATTGGDGKVEIPFPKDATGDVIVTINGKNYTGKVVDGKVVLDTTDLPAGNHPAVIYYTGDNKYSNLTKTIIINKGSDAVSPSNPMGNTTQATSTDDGKVEIPIPKDATGTATVVINGKEYPATIVDGKIVFDSKDIPAGNYPAIVKYSGDGKYNSSERTITMIIKETTNNNNIVNPPAVVKKASKFTAKKKTFKKALKVKKYQVTLKSGKTPIGKVKVTIKIGKKKFKAKTNAKGKATFKIKKFTVPGKYKAVIKFKGNAQYKPTTKKVKLTIK